MVEPHGELIASRAAVLPDGAVAEVVIVEASRAYKAKVTEARARWYADGGWSAWRLLAEAVRDVSVCADLSCGEPAALISAVVWEPVPVGVIAAHHVAHRTAYWRLTASGISPADL